MPMDITEVLKVEVAWTTAPWAVSPSFTDITTDVRSITWNWRGSSHGGTIEGSTCDIELDNFDGEYDADNSGSTTGPNIDKYRLVRVSASDDAFVTEEVMWTGYLIDLVTSSDGEYQSNIAQLSAFDGVGLLGMYSLEDVDVSNTRWPGGLMNTVLTEIGWPAGYTGTFDDGTARLHNKTVLTGSAISQFNDINSAECGTVWCDMDGLLQFRDKFHQLETTAWNTSQLTIDDTLASAQAIPTNLGALEVLDRVTASAYSGTTRTFDASTTDFPPVSKDVPLHRADYDATAEDVAQHVQEAHSYDGQRPVEIPIRVWPKASGTITVLTALVDRTIDMFHRVTATWTPRGSEATTFNGTVTSWAHRVDRADGWQMSLGLSPYDNDWTTNAANFYEWGAVTTATDELGY